MSKKLRDTMAFDRKKDYPKIEEQEHISNYQKGLDMQRERFKEAKFDGDLERMADSLENIKSEIKCKMISNNRMDQLNYIESLIKKYRTKDQEYIKNTPNGKKVIYPPNVSYLMNSLLTECFELLIAELDILGLLK